MYIHMYIYVCVMMLVVVIVSEGENMLCLPAGTVLQHHLPHTRCLHIIRVHVE